MTRFHSLPEVAAAHSLDDLMKDPVRWLTKEIKAGRIKGRKIGRSYAMSDADIKDFIESEAAPAPVTPIKAVRSGPSKGSMRGRLTA